MTLSLADLLTARRPRASIVGLGLAATLLACSDESPASAPPSGETVLAPAEEDSLAGTGKPTSADPILYHGGPVMTGPTHLYLIWYGSWDGNSATSILTDLAGSLGASPYFAINSSYMQMDFKTVSTDVTYAGEIADAYSRGKRLTDADVRRVVGKALSSGSLPTDENGIYLVITSADVVESSGFTKTYCGWHSHARLAKADIKFAFIGDPTTQGLGLCSGQLIGPNGNPGADAMARVFAHEVVESGPRRLNERRAQRPDIRPDEHRGDNRLGGVERLGREVELRQRQERDKVGAERVD